MQEIQDLADQQGWDPKTIGALALVFIIKNMLESDFLGFCLAVAEVENEMEMED